MQDLLAVLHVRSTRRRAAGLSLAEALWLLVLGAVATAAILWTLGRELDRARARQAHDALEYLAGHLELALGADLAGWPEGVAALHGPGDLPAGAAGSRPLAELLPPAFFVPIDPWGRAYLALRDPAARAVVVCAGADGSLDTSEELGVSLRVEFGLPRR